MLTALELGACFYVAWLIYKYGLANVEAAIYREGLVIPVFVLRAYMFAATLGDPFRAARKTDKSPDDDEYWRLFLGANACMYGAINEEIDAYMGDRDDPAFAEVVASCRQVFYATPAWKSRREFCARVEETRIQRAKDRAAAAQAQERREREERQRRAAEEQARAAERQRLYEEEQRRQRESQYSEQDRRDMETASLLDGEWFEVLLVDEDASPAEIKSAYRSQMKTFHPDRLRARPLLARRMTQQINAAYAHAKKLGKLKTTRA